MAVELGSAYGKILIDASGVSSGIGQARGILGGFQDTLAGVGTTLTTRVTAPLTGLGIVAAKTAGDFEAEMNVLSLAARDSGTSLEQLRDAAITAGADTQLVGISAAEAAEAMTNFYKAGLDTTDVFGDLNTYLEEGTNLTGALRAAVDLAAASDLDLASASDAVAVAMATYGLNAEEATAIADSFVRVADASVAEVSELVAAMENVGPTAAQFGWSLDDVNVALGLLSERGIRGSEAGTALKSMMTNLMRPTDDVVSTLNDMNVSLYNADGTMESLPEIMAQLQYAMEGMTDEQKNLTIQTLAGTYGMKAMATLLAEGDKGWWDMEEAVHAAASAQETAAARTVGFNASMEQLMGSLETFMITVGTPLIEDFLTPLIAQLTEALGWLLEQDPAWINMGIAIAGVLAVAGPLMIGLGALIPILGALLSPIGLIIAAVAALGLAWATNFGGIRDITASVFERIREIVETVLGYVAPFIQEQLGVVTAWVQANWPLIQETIATVLNAVQTVVQTVLGAIVQFWTDHGAQIMAVVQNVWGMITTIVSTAIQVVLGILQAIMQIITGDWEGAWLTIQNTALIVWEAIKALVQAAIDSVLIILQIGMDLVQQMLNAAWEAIKAAVIAAWEAIKAAVQQAIDDIVAFMQALPERAAGAIRAGLEALVNAGRAMVNSIKQGIKEKWDQLVDWLTDQVKKLVQKIRDALQFGSPSKPLFEMGQGLMESLALGMAQGEAMVARQVSQSFNIPAMGAMAGVPVGGGYAAAPTPAAENVSVSVNVERVGDDADIVDLAYQIAEVLKWRER